MRYSPKGADDMHHASHGDDIPSLREPPKLGMLASGNPYCGLDKKGEILLEIFKAPRICNQCCALKISSVTVRKQHTVLFSLCFESLKLKPPNERTPNGVLSFGGEGEILLEFFKSLISSFRWDLKNSSVTARKRSTGAFSSLLRISQAEAAK